MVQMFMQDLKKVSALWSVRFRVSALERFCYKGLFRNSSGTKVFVGLREVSALEDVCLREVPLYCHVEHCQIANIFPTKYKIFEGLNCQNKYQK